MAAGAEAAPKAGAGEEAAPKPPARDRIEARQLHGVPSSNENSVQQCDSYRVSYKISCQYVCLPSACSTAAWPYSQASAITPVKTSWCSQAGAHKLALSSSISSNKLIHSPNAGVLAAPKAGVAPKAGAAAGAPKALELAPKLVVAPKGEDAAAGVPLKLNPAGLACSRQQAQRHRGL